jgi:DNA replication and repair protein RecF
MITKLSLTNFRNYADQQFELAPDVTMVMGPNASGKTNLLESIYTLALTRSFRAKDHELTRHNQNFFRISAEYDKKLLALGYEQTEIGRRKQITHDGVRRPLSGHVGTLRVVLFEPNDLLLIGGPPDGRRRYLDFLLSQSDPNYLQAIQKYRRSLNQRNRLLAEWPTDSGELFAWDLKLAEYGSEITAQRQKLIEAINAAAPDIYREIAGQEVDLELVYRAQEATDSPTRFLAALEKVRQRDAAAGFTTIGPHRDDFLIKFKNLPIDTVASRGEMRSVVLALKMFEVSYIEQRFGNSPLLLLDDVFSELDEHRRHYLVQKLRGSQSVITTTNADIIEGLGGSLTISTAELQ